MNMQYLVFSTVWRIVRMWVEAGAMDELKEIVITLMDADMPGAEKREKALEMAGELFSYLSRSTVNFLIELAVGYVKAKEIDK